MQHSYSDFASDFSHPCSDIGQPALPSEEEKADLPINILSKKSARTGSESPRRPRSSLNELAKSQVVSPTKWPSRKERRVEGVYHVCVQGCGSTSAYRDVMKRHIMGSGSSMNRIFQPCSVAVRYAAAHGISVHDLRRVIVHEIYDSEEAKLIDFSRQLAPYTFYDPTMPPRKPQEVRDTKDRKGMVVQVDCSGDKQSSSVAQYSKAPAGKRIFWTKPSSRTVDSCQIVDTEGQQEEEEEEDVEMN